VEDLNQKDHLPLLLSPLLRLHPLQLLQLLPHPLNQRPQQRGLLSLFLPLAHPRPMSCPQQPAQTLKVMQRGWSLHKTTTMTELSLLTF
jgi:hypothetical protein